MIILLRLFYQSSYPYLMLQQAFFVEGLGLILHVVERLELLGGRRDNFIDVWTQAMQQDFPSYVPGGILHALYSLFLLQLLSELDQVSGPIVFLEGVKGDLNALEAASLTAHRLRPTFGHVGDQH